MYEKLRLQPQAVAGVWRDEIAAGRGRAVVSERQDGGQQQQKSENSCSVRRHVERVQSMGRCSGCRAVQPKRARLALSLADHPSRSMAGDAWQGTHRLRLNERMNGGASPPQGLRRERARPGEAPPPPPRSGDLPPGVEAALATLALASLALASLAPAWRPQKKAASSASSAATLKPPSATMRRRFSASLSPSPRMR